MAGAGPTPEFTDTFTVPADNYGDFIRLVRQNVNRFCDDRRPGVIQPVLPREQDTPRQWFHVVLRTKASSLTLAIRLDNLYLVGFRTPAGVWWELGRDRDTHLIRNSNWLGFGVSYADLVGHQRGLDAVTLGRAEMAAAVDVLAELGTKKLEELPGAQADPYALPKSKLVKLVIMICEGVRFHTVYGTLEKEFNSMAPRMTEIEGKQVREWEKISEAVLDWAVNENAKFSHLEKIGIKNKNDAARIVAIVKDKKPAA